jgi:hypothetical protein
LGRLLPAGGDAVEGKLSAAVDSEFSKLLAQYRSRAFAPRKVIESDASEAA